MDPPLLFTSPLLCTPPMFTLLMLMRSPTANFHAWGTIGLSRLPGLGLGWGRIGVRHKAWWLGVS